MIGTNGASNNSRVPISISVRWRKANKQIVLSCEKLKIETMRVLYISYDGMTDNLGQSQVLPYLKKLSEKGVEFELLSLEKPERSSNVEKINQMCKASGIHWHPLPYESGVPVISALRNYRRLKSKALALTQQHIFDATHCRSDIPGLIGYQLQQQYGVRFLFDMRGFWADERVEGKLWNLKHPLFKLIYSYFRKKEKQFFENADAVVSLTEKGKTIIETNDDFGKSTAPITVIPCCVDLEKFNPHAISEEEQNNIRQHHQLTSETFVLGYVGSIGTWYMLDEMLAFYAIHRKRHNESTFFFLSGEPAGIIHRAARNFGIPAREIVVHRAPHSAVPTYCSLFDAAVFFIRPTFSKSASSPTKQGELMAMGIPIICNAGVGDTDHIISSTNAGLVLANLNEQTMENCRFDPSGFSAKEIRDGAQKWFSLDKGAEKYYEVYQSMLQKD